MYILTNDPILLISGFTDTRRVELPGQPISVRIPSPPSSPSSTTSSYPSPTPCYQRHSAQMMQLPVQGSVTLVPVQGGLAFLMPNSQGQRYTPQYSTEYTQPKPQKLWRPYD